MAGKTLTAVQLAERIVMVLKVLEDLETESQKEVLDASRATCERLEKRK